MSERDKELCISDLGKHSVLSLQSCYGSVSLP